MHYDFTVMMPMDPGQHKKVYFRHYFLVRFSYTSMYDVPSALYLYTCARVCSIRDISASVALYSGPTYASSASKSKASRTDRRTTEQLIPNLSFASLWTQ